MRGHLQLGLLCGVLAAVSCGELDECENLPASFQLDMNLADPTVGPEVVFLAFNLRADATRWQQRLVVDGALDDGRTSIAINVTPAPSERFELVVDIAALDISTSTLAAGQVEAIAEPSGCNQFSTELR